MNDSFNVFFDGSFIPMGGEVPLLLCAPGITAAPGTLSELSQIVRDEDGHIMAVSSWADLFAAASCQLDFNLFCELKKDSDSEAFAELYNLFAELAYTGKLSFSAHPAELVAAGELKYALLSSCALSELELEGCTVSTMPDMYDEPSQFMSSVWGFAVTAGPGSSAKSASAFFKWLLEGSRLGDAALGCGLMPAAVCTVRNTPMSAALFDIYRGCRLYMAPDGSPYYTARAEFDSEVSSAMARLY